MLRCCAGICGGGAAERRPSGADPQMVQEHLRVAKPVVRVDELREPEQASFEKLMDRCGMQPAPPGVSDPGALVSPDFPKNSTRLLVVVPSGDAPPGAWNAQDTALPLLLWAQANNFAVALFSSQALKADPSGFWDRILLGSPARFAVVVVGHSMLNTVVTALCPLHPLLFRRFRAIFAADRDGPGAGNLDLEGGPTVPEQLQAHLGASLQDLPCESLLAEPMAHQRLFELILQREDRWCRGEAHKYSGFQNMKEGDKPGLKRMQVEERIQHLGRDRGNDELSRLLEKHEQATMGAGEDEEEPGVD
mmetsp:Transcript_15384/g.30313  ORF Transcript_15384/g.30313 Transcript_15384/m.30313 type:complete len:306 (-) Transcript_15384:86-1003(-)